MEFDAVIVGSGPNGLAAAIEIARAGHSVCVFEAADSIGGGTRSAELTLPGFIHDVCSAIHPLGAASPFLKSLPLAQHGLQWIHPPACLAHPLDDGTAVVLERSVEKTAAALGIDGPGYAKYFSKLTRNSDALLPEVLAPPIHRPRHPFLWIRFGINALQSAQRFSQKHFKGARAPALFAGLAGHSNMPLDTRPTAGFGLLLGMLGHAAGWPLARGGSQNIAGALASYLGSLRGEVVTGTRVKSLSQLPSSRAVLFDVSPLQLLKLAGDQFPPSYRWELQKFKHGPGVFKIDWALNSPIPWRSRECSRAGTLHLGGPHEAIMDAEASVSRGRCPDRPFVILAQPSLFDSSRAPSGKHTAWAYCHVPNGSKIDMTDRIESQIERFAPGFKDCIIEKHIMTPADFETYNSNYIGGDIGGGIQNILQIIARPSLRANPYSTPVKNLLLCSASTPPGGGVHGMCGFHAARAALRGILYNRRAR